MTSVFEYDVFLSFASSDEAFVKPIWQELSLSGLRVFWSNASLKKELGNSWSKIIQSALERSRHMLLVWSPAAMKSDWVETEYLIFRQECYKAGIRRLIPLLTQGCQTNDLPYLLRQLQASQVTEDNSLQDIISTLGGVNIEELRTENQALKQNLDSLRRDNQSLAQTIKELKVQLAKREKANESNPKISNWTLAKVNFERLKDSNPLILSSEKLNAFECLGLPSDAASQEIYEKYESLKKECGALRASPLKSLRELGESRLEELINAFELIFEERKSEEDEKIRLAFEQLQLPIDATKTEILKRYTELQNACRDAALSSDKFIKEAAAKELKNLESTFFALFPNGFTLDEKNEETGLINVLMPWRCPTTFEVTIMHWLKKEGETVEKGEILCTINTGGIKTGVASPATGILKKIVIPEEETVLILTHVAQIQETSGFAPTKKINVLKIQPRVKNPFSAVIESGKLAYEEEKKSKPKT